jgi:hypothetical protein
MSQQLRTWKEIAHHLGVSVRTAQNWERERRLPIHRISSEKSQVRALAKELDDWLAEQEQPRPVGAPPPLTMHMASATRASHLPVPPHLHIGHLCLCCLLYAGLFVLDLILEIAYQFDKLGAAALVVAPLVAAWIATSSALSLWTAWRWIAIGRRGGFALLTITFTAAAMLVFALLTCISVLPTTPVTLLRFPAQPAEIAYFKNILFYFLPLIICVWLVPFHFTACLFRQLQAGGAEVVLAVLERRVSAWARFDALYLSVRWLVAGMFLEGLASVILTQDLLRNLVFTRYTNLFMILAVTKSASYFALGVLCVTWYSRVLSGIRAACMQIS